jgi:type I restriction enzyme S subunit
MNQYNTYKPSGIDWLGDIPEHWEVKRVKDAAQICNGKSQIDVSTDDETKYPIYGSGGIMGYATDYIYKKPSLLLGRKGTIDKPIYVISPFWTIDTMFFTRIKNRNVINKYFYYSSLIIPFQALSTNTALPSMTQQSLALCLMVYPPLPEQTAISAYIVEKTSQIDAIISTLSQQIRKLTQLRKSLINYVVTGKIKITEE